MSTRITQVMIDPLFKWIWITRSPLCFVRNPAAINPRRYSYTRQYRHSGQRGSRLFKVCQKIGLKWSMDSAGVTYFGTKEANTNRAIICSEHERIAA